MAVHSNQIHGGHMPNMQGTIKREKDIKAVSNSIATTLARGSKTANVVRTVINDLKELTGITHLKQLNQEHVNKYVAYLQDRVENDELTTKTTSNYVFAMNDIIQYTNKYIDKNPNILERVSAKDNGLSAGSPSDKNPTIDKNTHETFINYLNEKHQQTGDIRYEALKNSIELAREFGLRIREAIGIKILNKDISNRYLKLNKQDCTKNSRERDITVTKESQINAINNAKAFAEKNNLYSLCPSEHLKQQIAFAYNVKADFEKEHNIKYRFHGERYAFAQERYNEYKSQNLTDKEAQIKLSNDLGHNRIDITERYLRFAK